VQLAAQEFPTLARGLDANKVYTFADVDAVNTFSGNLMIRIPIGPQYPDQAHFPLSGNLGSRPTSNASLTIVFPNIKLRHRTESPVWRSL